MCNINELFLDIDSVLLMKYWNDNEPMKTESQY